MKRRLSLLVLCCVLASCGSPYATTGEQLYLRSQNGPVLHVPSPLTTNNISYFYDLPAQTQPAQINIVPPTFGSGLVEKKS